MQEHVAPLAGEGVSSWAVRWLFVVSCSVLACTMPNPAFDPSERSDGGDDATSSDDAASTVSAGTSDSGGTSRGDDGESTSRAGSSGADDDVKGSSTGSPIEPSCDFSPSAGLALAFGDPSTFGNTCPNAVDVLARLGPAVAGETTVATCLDGCTACGGAHPLSAFPLSITDHLPTRGDGCVRLEATAPLGHDGSACYWGALTIYDPESGAPLVIATAESTPPTPAGAELLAGAIPEPFAAESCGCETLDDVDACCARSPEPPEFWAYSIDGQTLLAGESTSVAIDGAQYLVSIVQAESIPTCDGQALRTSWAVLHEP